MTVGNFKLINHLLPTYTSQYVLELTNGYVLKLY